MKNFLKMPCKAGFASGRIVPIMLLLLMACSNITSHAQTIGIIQGLTGVTPREGPPHPVSGAPTVEIPVVMGGPGELYINRFYKFNSNGELEDVFSVGVSYDPTNFTGWFGYCVCSLADVPSLYRAVTLNCPTGSAGPWKPDPWADPTLAVQTNSCTNQTAWTNPLTWYDYKVPTQYTGAFNLNRDVQLDVDFIADNKGITCSNSSALIINNDVTFTSINTNTGRFVNNGVMNGIGQHGNVINNAVLAPGVNGIGTFFVRGGKYTQNAGGSLNIQLESASSFDRLYCYQNSGDNVFGGTLKVSLLNGFIPVQNNSFKIFETGLDATYTGTFANADMPLLPNGLKWQVSYNPTDIRLTIVDSSILGGAFNFSDGGYATIPTNNFPVGNSNYTIESWVKTSDNTYNTIMFWGNTSSNAANAIRLEPGGKIRNYWWNNDLVVDAPTVNNGNWHHIAVTFDGTTRKIYMDGVLLGSDNPTGHNVSSGTTGFLGGAGYPDPFKGSLDEVRVFTRALTQAEISSTKNCEIPANTPGLSAYYKFNQGLAYQNNNIVTSFIDASLNGNNSNGLNGYALVDMVNNFVEGAIVNGQICGGCTGPAATPAVVYGQVNVCPYIGTNTQLTYSVASDANASGYLWTLPPTLSLISGQGTNSITVTINSGFSGNANKVIKVRVISSCGNSNDKLLYLLAQSPTTPSPIVASTNNICASIENNTAVTYTIPKVAASSYIWTAQSGTTIISHPNGTGENDTTVNVVFSSGFTTSIISVQAVNSCGTGTSGVRSLTIIRSNPATPGLINGPTNICPYLAPNGIPATYSVAAVASVAAFNWVVPAGAIGLTGQGTNSISFIYPVGYTGGTISVTATNGCGTSVSARTLSVAKLNPGTPGAIDVIQLQSCPNRQYSYSLASMPANATSVQWTVPAAAIGFTGQGTTSIIVAYPSTAVLGSVTATANSNCGNSGARSSIVKLPACAPPGFTNKAGSKEKTGSDQLKASAVMDPANYKSEKNIYPNPSHGDFNVRINTGEKEQYGTVQLIGMSGEIISIKKVVLNKEGTLITKINANGLVAGIYQLRYIIGHKTGVLKVVIIK